MMSEGGRSRGQVPFANLGGGARANAELPINENMGQTSPPPVSFADIMTVFRRAVREVKAGQTALEAGEARGGDTTYFNRTIVILLHLVCLLTKLIPHLEKEKVFEVKQAVYEFVNVGAKGRGGGSPLHLACARDSSSVGRYPICVFPSVAAIELLLECGADPNGKDNDGNTALHTAALNKPAKPAVIQTLLDHGAHFDTVNTEKKAFFNLLKGQPLHEITNSVRHTSLACLASRVVRKHGLDTSVLPTTLQNFVAGH